MKTQTKPNAREGLKPVMVYLPAHVKKLLQYKAIEDGVSMDSIIRKAVEREVTPR